MKTSSRFAVVFVTAPNLKTARSLARAALQARLIACANIVPRVESHYWWQGRMRSSPEVLLLLKTQRDCLEALERLVVDNHPYETPEFIATPLLGGNEKYLSWLSMECATPSSSKRKSSLRADLRPVVASGTLTMKSSEP